MYLSDYASGRNNNFNLIRFIAASLVLFSHSYPLALGIGTPEPLSQSLGVTWGSIAVDVFFIASGFFIAASFTYKSSVKSFIFARLLRIYPALIVVITLSVFVLGPAFTSLDLISYFSDSNTYRYWIKDSLIISGITYDLPGVFESNPYPSAVNGSLWTLPYEIKMYILLSLSIIGFEKLKKGLRLNTDNMVRYGVLSLAVIALIAHLINFFIKFYDGKSLQLFAMFFMGSSFFYFKNRIPLSHKAGILFIVLLLISTLNKSTFATCYTLVITYIVFYLAYLPKGRIRDFNKLGDYSYGIYIYAFPVQQSIAYLIEDISIIGMIISSFIVTLTLAIVSWNIIEERCLRFKHRFV